MFPTLVLHPHLKQPRDVSARTAESRLAEAVRLADAIALSVLGAEVCTLSRIIPATFLGEGRVAQFKTLIAERGIALVVINASISPVQQRNLEEEWACKVWDRTALILEIFSARARTGEGKLQVELASLEYQKSRLVRTWTHLERQRGGFGFLAGPGETQIETDRRLLSGRITKIKRQLETVVKTRGLHRKARKRVPYPVIALVGYTNAGKSTLFNRLTEAQVRAEDLLFATLDPTMRRVILPSKRMVIMSDTVGFITDLPTQLVAAFRATLEEVIEADLILHVRDISHEETEEQKHDVEEVLISLGLEEKMQTNRLEVWNKLDLLAEEVRHSVQERAAKDVGTIAVSAVSGEGMERLFVMLDRMLSAEEEYIEAIVPHAEGALRAWIHEHGYVRSVVERDEDCLIQFDLPRARKEAWLEQSRVLFVRT